MAMHFAEQGYDIALHYHHSEPEAKALKEEIVSRKVRCELFRYDLSKVAGFVALMEEIKAVFPHCAGLVNNASVFERAEFLHTDESLFDRQFAVNLKAPFFLTQAFAKAFTKGTVINILDTDIVQTQGSHFAYLLSKKTLAEFTRMAARALGPDLRVNGICPGIMLPSNELDEAYMGKLQSALPLQNLATPQQVAETACWLHVSEVTGQLIYLDGGQHLL